MFGLSEILPIFVGKSSNCCVYLQATSDNNNITQ